MRLSISLAVAAVSTVALLVPVTAAPPEAKFYFRMPLNVAVSFIEPVGVPPISTGDDDGLPPPFGNDDDDGMMPPPLDTTEQ